MLLFFQTNIILKWMLPFSKPISSYRMNAALISNNIIIHHRRIAALISNKYHLRMNAALILKKIILESVLPFFRTNIILKRIVILFGTKLFLAWMLPLFRTNFTMMNDALISNKCYPIMNVALTWLGTISGKKKRTMQYL